jgi:hypothetical protein
MNLVEIVDIIARKFCLSTHVCFKKQTGLCSCTGVVRIKSVFKIEKVWSFDHITGLFEPYSLNCFIMICIHSCKTKKAPISIPKMDA